jgi:hypothetical protein
MRILWLLSASLITALAAAQDSGDDTTYEFVLRNGGKSVFGWIQEDRGDDVIVKVDAPWEGRERIVTLREKSIENKLPENAAGRAARIEQGWKDRNFALVETASGSQWLPKADVVLAGRAAEMAKAVEPAVIPHVPVLEEEEAAPVAPAAEPLEEMEPPGVAAQWGAQAALLVVACVLIGLISKILVFRSED